MVSCCCTIGSLWQSNISLTYIPAVRGRSALAVSFSPDRLCEEYIVIVNCLQVQHVNHIYKVRSHHARQYTCGRLSHTEDSCIFLFSDLTQNITCTCSLQHPVFCNLDFYPSSFSTGNCVCCLSVQYLFADYRKGKWTAFI